MCLTFSKGLIMSIRVHTIDEVENSVEGSRYDLQVRKCGQWMYSSSLMWMTAKEVLKEIEDRKKYGDECRILTARD